MWSKQKSLILSIVMTVITFFLIIAGIVFMPRIMELYSEASGVVNYGHIMTALYVSAVFGLLCTFSLFRLLINIKKGEVFIHKNVKLLRGISWCCVAVGLIYLGLGREHIWLVLLSFAAMFFGLILRVIKNVFERAITIKEENEFTI